MKKIGPAIVLGLTVVSIRTGLVHLARAQSPVHGPYQTGRVLGAVVLGLIALLTIRKFMRD